MRCFDVCFCVNDGKIQVVSKEGIQWKSDHAGHYFIDTPNAHWPIFFDLRPANSWFSYARVLVDPTKSLETSEKGAVCLQLLSGESVDKSQVLALVRIEDDVPLPDWDSFVDDSFQYARDSAAYVCGDKESSHTYLLLIREDMNYTLNLGDRSFLWEVSDGYLQIEESSS